MLRWVLIIASSYLLIVDASASHVGPSMGLLIAVALASNVAIARMPAQWLDNSLFDFGVVLFDAGWVTAGLILAPNVSGDLFLLYFLVIFVAAMGESISMIVGSAILVSVVYAGTLSIHPSGDFRITTAALLRVPFLFVVALFYGYFVTEIRGRRGEATEAQLREQAKSELLAAVSHDLRGPLGNAENLLALALESDDHNVAADRSLLVRAQVNIRRVNSLVSNLLQAACIEAGKVHLQHAPVQVNDIVDDILGLESGAASLNEITLGKQIDHAMPVIRADHMQIGRIVANLVSNAIKYTSHGGTVTVRTRHDEDNVYISVHDNGPGMTTAQCDALFAPYRRVHLGGYTPGMGLGLFIVKRLTEALGGRVSVQSETGVGSTFVVAFARGHLPGATRRKIPFAARVAGYRGAHVPAAA